MIPFCCKSQVMEHKRKCKWLINMEKILSLFTGKSAGDSFDLGHLAQAFANQNFGNLS